jgi:hypothetical protein
MKERIKIKRYLRKEMNKIPDDATVQRGKNPFYFCYAQAKFDVLLNIDMDLKLGAFIKGGLNNAERKV